MLRWQIARDGLPYPAPQRAKAVLEQALNSKIYRMPSVNTEHYVSSKKKFDIADVQKNIILNFEHIISTKKYILADGWTFIYGEEMTNSNISLVLKSAAKAYMFDTNPRTRPDVTDHHRRGNLDDSGFLALIEKSLLAPGTYRIGVTINRKDSAKMKLSSQTVIVE